MLNLFSMTYSYYCSAPLSAEAQRKWKVLMSIIRERELLTDYLDFVRNAYARFEQDILKSENVTNA